MKKRLLYFCVGIFFLGVFYGCSRWVKNGGLKDTDFAITVKIQERIDTSSRLRTARVVGEVMEGSSFLASPEVSVVVVLLITVLAGIDRRKRRLRWQAIGIPIFFALLVLGEVYGKTVVHHPAPPFFMIKNPTTVFPKYYINDEFSYPSGHAARAVFMAIMFWFLTIQQWNDGRMLRRKAWIGLGFGIYIGLVAVSRIYLGHHWFSDIVGGGLLGGGIAFFVWSIL